MTTARPFVAAGLALAFVGATLLQPPAPRPADDAPSATAAVAPAASPRHGSGVHRAPETVVATAPAPSRDLLLPDGKTVPTLNGAVDAEPLATYWGPFPWSPVVAVERNDQGLDWYRHADGSYSTTQMVWRQDLGRMAAMTRVAHPGREPAATAAR